MKTLLHPDYWIEVPAGEFLKGLSDAQRGHICARIRDLVGYESFPASQRQLIESAIAKFRQYAQRGGMPHEPVPLSDEEKSIWDDAFHEIFAVERRVMYRTDHTPVWMDRFYIARFSITHRQRGTFKQHSVQPGNLPGALEEPLTDTFGREVSTFSTEEEIQGFCQALGGRLPHGREWEKAARGIDGRLYPWGNKWDPEAGFFHYGQDGPHLGRVDAFPRGVSPYGVWGMAGGLPELVSIGGSGRRGCHAKESSAEMAWFDHILEWGGTGWWASLRPVLDEWPQQQLSGFQAGLAEPNAEALQKMGPLADLLLTQYDWAALTTAELNVLEPPIVALREARRADCLELLNKRFKWEDASEPAWLLRAAAIVYEDLVQARESVRRALEINPASDVGRKMANVLKPPVHFLSAC